RLRLVHAQRRRERRDLNERKWARQNAILEGLGCQQAMRARLGVEEPPRRLVGDELDGDHLAHASHVADEAMASDALLQALEEIGSDLGRLLDQAFALENVDIDEP